MSRLRAILDDINAVEATIARVSRDADTETAFADKLVLQSLENRRQILHNEMADAARSGFVEVCDYRLIPDSPNSYALSAVTGALREFQDLVTIVFDAITTRPKTRASYDPAVVEKTRFDFGFAYSGSLGVALVIENERLLGIESDLDRAIGAVFGLMKVDSAPAVQGAVENYGTAAIRKLHSLSKIHRDYGLSADIKWVRGTETRNHVLAQPQEFSALCSAIETRGDEATESVVVRGLLAAWNTVGRSFILFPPDADPIRGVFSKTFDDSKERNVPHQHVATLTKRTVFNYATGEEGVTWVLEDIEELN